MKTRRLISIICLLAILTASFSLMLSASDYVYEKPVESSMWENANFDDPSTYAYSIAFVGDTQYITCGDYFLGTKKLQQQYKYIAETAEERKLEHVFVLGDITDMGYWNDANLASKHVDPPVTGEWEIAKSAISQLDAAGVTYQLCRGNHDDYMIDDYFNVPEYTDQFKDCGGFYSDSTGTHPSKRETKNPKGYIYWSAKTGYHKDSIVNSWKTVELYGTKYLFVTIDYNPTRKVTEWLDELLAQYPDHKAIITTHSYLNGNGDTISSEVGDTMYPLGFTASYIWKRVLAKHANVFMVVSGHVGITVPLYSIAKGDNGNKVYQVLIDPQSYDVKETDSKGTVASGTQDTGLVMYMNFSEDGNTISFNYYSTLLNKFLKGANYTIRVDNEVDEVGSIDMAGLADFGQVTPMVTEKTTPTLDGVVNDGEYKSSKVTKKDDIGRGTIGSDLTEHFAYDDEYLYYAVTARIPTTGCSLNLHLGSTLYNVSEINDSLLHSKKLTVSLADGACKQTANEGYSKIKNNKDIECKVASKEGYSTYEIKIRREYLSDNNSPDNLLSYSFNFGTGTHYYAINNDARAHLENLGLKKVYQWTYNYAYFGTRPETTPETTIPETTIPETTVPETTDEGENSGCGSTIAFAAVSCITVVSAGAVIMINNSKKKKDD